MNIAAQQQRIDQHWPQHLPEKLSTDQADVYRHKIKQQLIEKNAVLVAHYYVDDQIQQLAEETGGIVADSLEMARFGAKHSAQTLVVAGVRFMGETAKILSPEKTILMPTLEATCSLDLSCPTDEFTQFCAQYPDHKVVVYANSSVAVKAQADWVVTSSIALDVVRHLDARGEKILWAPDRYLGHYIQQQTGANMVMWHGSCMVHEEFKTSAIQQLKQAYQDAAVLVHPESPADVIALADAVGSTSQLLAASQHLANETFIVATDKGIIYKMQQASPHKTFIPALSGGHGATCRSCAHCPWMAMNGLQNLADVLDRADQEITVDPTLAKQALVPLKRMQAFQQ